MLCRFNKYILAPDLGGFPYPLTLTSVHMVFCSAVSWVLVKLRLVEVQDMPLETYTRCVVPQVRLTCQCVCSAAPLGSFINSTNAHTPGHHTANPSAL